MFAGAMLASATGAFFSDTETSTGNTFAAGDIDLRIDNTSYVTNAAGVLVASPANTWTLADLTNQLFFSFADVKPGDIGEDTISIHPGSNDAYACMAADITATPDNGINEPEADADDITDGVDGGELQDFLNFSFWEDDGDNVYETGEVLLPDLQGSADEIFDGGWNTISDSNNGPALPGGSTTYVGKAWCFGTLTANGTIQDGNGSSTPLTRGTTGFTCNGAGDNNIAQTDGITVDVSFYAVQARNNGQFLCSSLPVFNGEEPWTDAGTRTSGTASIVEVEGAPEGKNVLELITINDNDSRVRYSRSLDFDLDDLTSISFEANQVTVPAPAQGYANAALRLFVDLDGNVGTVGDVTEIVYEPYYNFNAENSANTQTSILPATWQTWNITQAAGKFWANGGFLGSTPNGGAYATNFTIAQVLGAHPSAKVVGISMGLGTWNPGWTILVDNLVVNGDLLGFE